MRLRYAVNLSIVLLSIVCLTGCSANRSKSLVSVDKAIQKASWASPKSTDYQAKLKQVAAKVKSDSQKIAVLLAESDEALKQLQQLKQQSVNPKDIKSYRAQQLKIKQAQDLADAKAQALVEMKQQMDQNMGTIAVLQQEQIRLAKPADKVGRKPSKRNRTGKDHSSSA